MITTKSCSTCEHFPNDHHCVGCVWDEAKDENTKWELKENPIVIERAVLDKIRSEIENDWQLKKYPSSPFSCGLKRAVEIIDKYKAESEDKG